MWVRGLKASREAGEGPCEFRWDAGLHLRAIEKRRIRGPWRELVSGKLGETQLMIRGD